MAYLVEENNQKPSQVEENSATNGGKSSEVEENESKTSTDEGKTPIAIPSYKDVYEAIIALPAYLAGYIERLGTGTTDVVETCVAAGLPAPEYKLSDLK
ncbi:MAG: hypothetical protein MJZ17_00390 [Bacteroidales bacterium]|nr:hypothetical protein [Bacteroidales bacterium]